MKYSSDENSMEHWAFSLITWPAEGSGHSSYLLKSWYFKSDRSVSIQKLDIAMTKSCKELFHHNMHKHKKETLMIWWIGRAWKVHVFWKMCSLGKGREEKSEAQRDIGGFQPQQTGSYLKPDAFRIFACCGVPVCFPDSINSQFTKPPNTSLFLDSIIINMVIGC